MENLQLGKLTIPHRLIMAPMCGITLKPFRKVVKKFGAGLVMTQMVSATALVRQDKKTRQLLEYEESERPIAFQLFGHIPAELGQAAKICEDMGADLVDLNMGCPATKIVQGGGGSALLKDIKQSEKIFQEMRSALTIPFTVKMRSGWDKYHDSSLDIAKLAEACGVDGVTLHARTRAQGYSGESDWNLIGEMKARLKIPVIGNGDVRTLEDVQTLLGQTGCDGVMIGRLGMSEPWFFKSYLEQKNYCPTPDELREIIFEQYQDSFALYGEEIGVRLMRKHLCCYTKGLPDGGQFRNSLVRLEKWVEVQNELQRFFNASRN